MNVCFKVYIVICQFFFWPPQSQNPTSLPGNLDIETTFIKNNFSFEFLFESLYSNLTDFFLVPKKTAQRA